MWQRFCMVLLVTVGWKITSRNWRLLSDVSISTNHNTVTSSITCHVKFGHQAPGRPISTHGHLGWAPWSPPAPRKQMTTWPCWPSSWVLWRSPTPPPASARAVSWRPKAMQKCPLTAEVDSRGWWLFGDGCNAGCCNAGWIGSCHAGCNAGCLVNITFVMLTWWFISSNSWRMMSKLIYRCVADDRESHGGLSWSFTEEQPCSNGFVNIRDSAME